MEEKAALFSHTKPHGISPLITGSGLHAEPYILPANNLRELKLTDESNYWIQVACLRAATHRQANVNPLRRMYQNGMTRDGCQIARPIQ